MDRVFYEMINDKNKDFLYLADTLPKKYPKFYVELSDLLSKNKIKFQLIEGTKDVWTKDYMPVQNGLGELIQFKYTPDYLKRKKYSAIITNVSAVCRKLNLPTIKSNLIIDGGNIVHYGNKVVMCDKVLKENKNIPKKELIAELRQLLRVNHVLLIPTHPEDILGHADGILRFIENKTVLVSDFSKENPKFEKELKDALMKHKLIGIKIPNLTFKNKNSFDATGLYINFLQMKGIIFVPAFGKKEDKNAEDFFRKLFPKDKVVPVNCKEIAKQGGLLNCISWAIKSNYPKPLSEYEKEVERDLMCLGLE